MLCTYMHLLCVIYVYVDMFVLIVNMYHGMYLYMHVHALTVYMCTCVWYGICAACSCVYMVCVVCAVLCVCLCVWYIHMCGEECRYACGMFMCACVWYAHVCYACICV